MFDGFKDPFSSDMAFDFATLRNGLYDYEKIYEIGLEDS